MPRNGSGTYILPVNSWNPATNGNSATAADWQSLIDDVESAVTQSVSADGQTPMSGNLNANNNKITNLAAGSASGDSLRWQQLFSQGANTQVPSAATVDIGAQNTNFIEITGTTTITSLGANYNGPRFLRFTGILILTHNATTLNLPGGANITTAAGDTCIAIPNSTPNGWNIVQYQRTALVPGTATSSSTVASLGSGQFGAGADIASAATINFTTRTGNIVRITGTTTTNAVTLTNGDFVVAIAVGAWPINISGVLTYTCAANDRVLFWQDNSGAQHAEVLRFDGLPRIDRDKIQSISASVGSSALTISASYLSLDFRSTTLGSGTVTTVSGTPANLVISSGSTLGTANGVQSDIAVLAINNAGIIELAVVNTNGGFDLSESGIISTTAEGGAGGADSVSVAYSTTARSNVAYRLIGFIRSTQATAGTWTTAPSLIQGQGGVSMGQITNVWKGALQTAAGGSIELGLTGIPSWLEHIEVTTGGLSTNGTAEVQLQLGASGGYQTSGYTGTVYDASTNGSLTNGFRDNLASAAAVREYTYILNKHDGNTWKCTMGGGLTNTPASRWINGTVTLSGTLDRIRVITSNATDTIDSGSTLKIRGW